MIEVIATYLRVCTRRSLIDSDMNAFIRIVSCLFIITYSLAANAVSEISIRATHVEHPQGDAQNVALHLNLNQPTLNLNLSAALKQKAAKDWTQLSLDCGLPQDAHAGELSCAEGLLKNSRIHVPFSVEINRFSSQGVLDVDATLQLKNASLSDEAGLHATEKLNAKLAISLKQDAEHQGRHWVWRTALDWQSGEVFWQPVYFGNGGHQLLANGTFSDDLLSIASARLMIKEVGTLEADAQVRMSDFNLLTLNANLPNLNLSTAYPLLFKPFLEKTAFNSADLAGRAALSVHVQNNELTSFELGLTNVDIVDRNQKFAFYKVNAHIPWSYDAPKNISFGYDNGTLLNLPLGKTNIEAEVNRFSLTAPSISLPILDGALNLSGVSAARIGGQWYWHLSASLAPVSMADFSTQLKLPKMLGKASADIPLVTYSGGILTTDGSVVLNVFSGTATVTQLTMHTPLGIAPKLNADIALRNLDLGDLTRTFSFGAIEGKLDGDIEDLELQNWKPVRFDAVVQSSPGKYPKKISQRAVENISALGGGGAAAAVQRSFLRFFEQFNYGKMGLSCRLRNDICQMGGVESTPHGYVIVKGSGIPAITVMGYNQTVGWSELLGRIKRVTDGNSKAIVK